MTFVLAIDQGTSGTKAAVVDAHGIVLAIAEETLRPVYLPGGGVEQDPEALLASVLGSGRKALGMAGVAVSAVALANQGESVLAWDKRTGRPLSNVVVWQDRRAEELCDGLAGHRQRVAELTGLELGPYFSAPKMRWLRDHVTTDGVVTTTDTWLIHRLCGAFVTDVTTASRSLALNLADVTWDSELLSLFGLADEQQPQIVSCDDVVGTTTAFGPEAPVAGLIVDQQAALLAQRCFDAGTAKCTFGTGAFLLAQCGDMDARSSVGLTTSIAWRLRDEVRYCLDGQVYTAASVVRWLADLGLIASPSELDSVSAIDSSGVLCVPALAGLAAPWWDGTATGSLTGLSLSTGKGELIKAALDGIAAQVAELARRVGEDLGGGLDSLRVDGGLTRSRVLMQAQADIAQLPVEVYPSPHATVLGAAACAHLAVDPTLDVAAAVGNWRPTTVFEPKWSRDRAEEFMTAWNRQVDALRTGRLEAREAQP